jgi:hypothetical protein
MKGNQETLLPFLSTPKNENEKKKMKIKKKVTERKSCRWDKPKCEGFHLKKLMKKVVVFGLKTQMPFQSSEPITNSVCMDFEETSSSLEHF